MNPINNQIKHTEVRVIDSSGNQIGVYRIQDALRMAYNEGLDLIEINSTTKPAIVKIYDYSKFKYELSKKEKESKGKKNQIKEIYLRPVTGQHDVEIKAKHAKDFISEDNRVKVEVKFRGRENSHIDEGIKVFNLFMSKVGEVKYIQAPQLNGQAYSAVFIKAKTEK